MTRISEASEVSFTSEMKVFESGGTETRAACGRMMRRSVVAARHPDRVAGLPLALRHREDRGADDLGSVPAHVERERDDRARPRVEHDADRRQPVEDHEELHEQWRAADHRDVEPGDARHHAILREPHERDAERDHEADRERRRARAGSCRSGRPARGARTNRGTAASLRPRRTALHVEANTPSAPHVARADGHGNAETTRRRRRRSTSRRARRARPRRAAPRARCRWRRRGRPCPS